MPEKKTYGFTHVMYQASHVVIRRQAGKKFPVNVIEKAAGLQPIILSEKMIHFVQ
jgi:predicted ribosome quality control (RQC) complex YloA/Tae2 family protein